MRVRWIAGWAILLGSVAMIPCLTGQSVEDSLDIYTEHPRLFLRPQRLRLLRRERDRRTTRWQQFETLMAGKAPMPEMGFAQALYYQVSGDAEAGKQAVRWALGPASDLRQLALVFDWCQGALTEAQSKTLAAKIVKLIAASDRNKGVPAERDYALFEVLHAVRENVNLNLLAPVPGYFKGLPIFHLLTYYPATFAAPEGEY